MSVSNRRRNHLMLSKALLVMGVLWGGFSDGAGIAAPRNPTTITSGKSRKAIFEKSVVLTRDNMVIRADRMIVYFKKDSPGKSEKSSGDSFGQQVDVVDAQGHVIIEKEDGKATSGRAVYYKDQEKVVLTESPVAWQNGTRVTGTQMTIFLKEEESEGEQ